MTYYSELPEPIIHHIQSLFNPKEAAITTLLSKSWRSAWSTRPTIDLDEDHFPRCCSRYSDYLDPLMAFADKAFRRYEESDLRIHTFRLCFKSKWYSPSGLAANWTSKAIKLGASDITIRFNRHQSFVVPIDEVFGSENVVRLCLQGLVINRLEVIKCSGLKSLTLDDVEISICTLRNIFSCCPLIEKLSLLTHVSCLEKLEQGVTWAGISPLHKLTSLVLCNVEPDELQALFLGDMSSKFPVLKDLTIKFINLVFFRDEEAKEMYVISSRSLEVLNFCDGTGYYYNEHAMMRRVELDLPSIRKFTFQGYFIPKLCFSPTSGDQWDSYVSITRYNLPRTTWFSQLSKLLSNLRGSKIHLLLHLHLYDSTPWILSESDYQAGKIKGSNARQVEDLTIYTKNLWPEKIYNYLLDGLFRICRPKMITQYVNPSNVHNYQVLNNNDDYDELVDNNEGTRKIDLLLCKALEQGLAAKCFSMRSQFMYGLRHLEEVNVQELQDEVWIPQTMASISDDSTSEERRFRFQLKWQPYGVSA